MRIVIIVLGLLMIPTLLQAQDAAYPNLEPYQAEITNPESIRGCCAAVDVVISTVGLAGR